MLLELRVENLLLIERAELRLGPGLNVVTGETGAGKTVLAHALDLLLGGKPRPGIVRPGASEAWVEGVFAAPAGLLDDPALAELRERLPEQVEELVLGRRVGADGRTRAFVQGRSASAADLRELGPRLVAFYGQHEHRRLVLGSAQLEALDAFCGPDHLLERKVFAAARERAIALGRQLEAARVRAGTRDRDLDLLRFELQEIDELGPDAGEREALADERARLRHLDALLAAAAAGAEALAPDAGDAPGVVALASGAEQLATAVAGADKRLDVLAERLSALRIEADDLAGELRAYAAGLEAEPGRLEVVEERLAQYDRLERKHGGSVSTVLEHAERCRAEIARLEHAEEEVGEIEAALALAEEKRTALAGELTRRRTAAAPRLARRVLEELSALAMAEASFEVRVEPRDEDGPAGADRVEFVIAPNPGVPAQPLRETASGGELSRVMLALTGVAAADGGATLVFDEVDAGIGGQTARAVGERLRALGSGRQVVCITHLPQIASLADRHFRIAKQADGDRSLAAVEQLDAGAVVEELVRMLGADSGDAGARKHARELLAAA